jgi:hypothetical protein
MKGQLKERNFLTSCGTVSFPRRTLPNGVSLIVKDKVTPVTAVRLLGPLEIEPNCKWITIII